jgi:hypothetical protein
VTPTRLHPADLEALAELVVEGLAERLGAQAPTRGEEWLDAAEVARRFGVTRGFVYDHADELGAVGIGDGPRPRLRFDARQVAARMAARSASERSLSPNRPPQPRSRPAGRRRTVSGSPLLPIRGQEG